MMLSSAHTPFVQFTSCCIQYRKANITATGIAEAGNDQGRTATSQSFRECLFIIKKE